ncbi:hypothetical protein N0V86_006337 [Didymella sp. IMI 355093]|nr:hypothetical protein N0V86_006337 [Didymella sp. IMI 355093]
MGVSIGEYDGFCICDLDKKATKQDFVDLLNFGEATGISQEQQVEFARRCWAARTKALEGHKREQSERARYEAEAERARLQALREQNKRDASIVCAFVPIPRDLQTPKYLRFLKTSGILPTVVVPLQSDTKYTDADIDLL